MTFWTIFLVDIKYSCVDTMGYDCFVAGDGTPIDCENFNETSTRVVCYTFTLDFVGASTAAGGVASLFGAFVFFSLYFGAFFHKKIICEGQTDGENMCSSKKWRILGIVLGLIGVIATFATLLLELIKAAVDEEQYNIRTYLIDLTFALPLGCLLMYLTLMCIMAKRSNTCRMFRSLFENTDEDT